MRKLQKLIHLKNKREYRNMLRCVTDLDRVIHVDYSNASYCTGLCIVTPDDVYSSIAQSYSKSYNGSNGFIVDEELRKKYVSYGNSFLAGGIRHKTVNLRQPGLDEELQVKLIRTAGDDVISEYHLIVMDDTVGGSFTVDSSIFNLLSIDGVLIKHTTGGGRVDSSSVQPRTKNKITYNIEIEEFEDIAANIDKINAIIKTKHHALYDLVNIPNFYDGKTAFRPASHDVIQVPFYVAIFLLGTSCKASNFGLNIYYWKPVEQEE